MTALLILGLLVSIAALCWQGKSCNSLREDLSSKDLELREARARLSSTLEAITDVKAMLDKGWLESALPDGEEINLTVAGWYIDGMPMG